LAAIIIPVFHPECSFHSPPFTKTRRDDIQLKTRITVTYINFCENLVIHFHLSRAAQAIHFELHKKVAVSLDSLENLIKFPIKMSLERWTSKSSENSRSKSLVMDFRILFLGLFNFKPEKQNNLKGGMGHVVETNK
jgi:hypothetical protein